MKITTNFIKQTKRHLSASGSILLPLALKWRLVGALVCALSGIAAQNVSAATITLSMPSALTVNVTPTADGTFAKSNPGSISVTSDAYAGHTLTVKGKTDNDALTSGGNSLPSITETAGIDENTFNSATYNNKWGYKPTKKDSADNTKFFPGPKLSGDTIDVTKSANPKVNTYSVELGVRVNNEQANGTYAGTFIFAVTANNVPYTINYHSNDATSGPGTPQTGSGAEGSTVNLDTATKRGYLFKGWCDNETNNTTCNGTTYQAGETYKLRNNANIVNLYALWQPMGFEDAFAFAGKQKEGQYYKMQDMTAEICDLVTVPSADSTATLIDIRDNNTYTVAKLLDGKCWMTQNLRIVDKILTAQYSDINNASFVLPESNLDNFWMSNENPTDKAAVYVANNTGYYSWFTATAGQGTAQKLSGETTESICAKAWKLPSYDDFDELVKSYTLASIQQAPSNFDLAGAVSNKIPSFFNECTFAWPSTASTNAKARYYLRICSNKHPGTVGFSIYTNANSEGFPVRCIVRE